MTILTDLYNYIFTNNPFIGSMIVVFFIIPAYPTIYKKYEFIRDINIFPQIFNFLILNGYFKPKLTSYNKQEFVFKHDLLDDVIKSNKTISFNDLYENPYFSLINDLDEDINNKTPIESIIDIIENKTILQQLVIIEGKAGYGKTNFLRFLGYLVTNNSLQINTALLMQANDIEKYLNTSEDDFTSYELFLSKTGKKLIASLHFCFRKKGLKVSTCELKKTLSRKCLLLLDGFDELNNNNNSDKIISLLRDLKTENPNLIIVITGRPGSLPINTSYHQHKDFHYRINSLDIQAIESMIKKTLLKIHGESNYTKEYIDFRERIINNNAIYRMAKIPFLLTLMIRLREKKKDLPEHRDKLISSFISLAVKRKLKNNENGTPNFLTSTLCQISFDTVNSKFSLKKTKEYIKNQIDIFNFSSFKNPSEVISYLRMTGLLIHDSNKLEFIHKSIGDHLCAKHIFELTLKDSSNPPNEELFYQRKNIDIVFFYCCLIKDASTVFKSFIRKNQYKTCLELIAWKHIGSNIFINPLLIDRFWDTIKNHKNKHFEAHATLYLALMRLRYGDTFSEEPVSKTEYEHIVGKLNKRNIRDNDVVGLDENEINNFFTQLNIFFKKEANQIENIDDNGSFKPLSAHYRIEKKIHDDTIVEELRGLSISQPNSYKFIKIKQKISEELKKRIKSTALNINSKFRIIDMKNFQDKLFNDIINCYTPELFLKTNNHHTCSLSDYSNLRTYLFGSGVSYRDQIFRDNLINHKLITGNNLNKNEQQIFDDFVKSHKNGLNFSSDDIELMLLASMYRLISSLLTNPTPNEYCYSINTYLKVLVINMADNQDLDLWGRIQIQHTLQQ